MKRVLVAGATGYLGGFVAPECKARGYFVWALARSARKGTLAPNCDMARHLVGERVRAGMYTLLGYRDYVCKSRVIRSLEAGDLCRR